MGILSWILIGLIAGVIAELILPGARGGWIVTILIGVIGAIIGGYVVGLFGYGGVTGINIWSIVVATIGAIIVLAVYRLVAR